MSTLVSYASPCVPSRIFLNPLFSLTLFLQVTETPVLSELLKDFLIDNFAAIKEGANPSEMSGYLRDANLISDDDAKHIQKEKGKRAKNEIMILAIIESLEQRKETFKLSCLKIAFEKGDCSHLLENLQASGN